MYQLSKNLTDLVKKIKYHDDFGLAEIDLKQQMQKLFQLSSYMSIP